MAKTSRPPTSSATPSARAHISSQAGTSGQSIVLEKNEGYFKGAANIDRIIFKIVPDDNAQAMQLESGELDLALLDPKNAQQFQGKDGFACYDLKTSDYRGILFNFWNDYWTRK